MAFAYLVTQTLATINIAVSREPGTALVCH